LQPHFASHLQRPCRGASFLSPAHPGVRSEAVKRSRRLSLPHVSCAAPSALESIVIPNPGLTAGPTHCRLFEAGLEIIDNLASIEWATKPGAKRRQ